MHLYPLRFRPIYKEKVWGGRRLERLGRDLPGDAHVLIGESWEIADLASTSPSGGGGEPARSVVANGPGEGVTLDGLLKEHRAAYLGDASPAPDEGFPLLVKYLDARQNLSVQVHPSPEYAARHPGARLKSEAWYVVDAEPGASIYKGVVSGTRPEQLAEAIAAGHVNELLIDVPARTGDCHYLPSGTCHALGAGILVAEVQTPSDTTFRVYDWGRTDRELHIEEALACITPGPVDVGRYEPGASSEEDGRRVRSLVRCPHFSIDEWTVTRPRRLSVDVGRAEVWMVVAGQAELRSPSGAYEAEVASAGRTFLMPAGLPPTVLDVVEPMVMLRITLPGV